MKKLLIATTALVATAGMASADITISGHEAAGIYSGLSNKDGTAAVKAKDAVVGEVTSAEKTILDAMTGSNTATVDAAVDQSAMAALQKAVADAQLLFDADVAAGLVSTTSAANLAFAKAELAAAQGTQAVAKAAATVGTYSADGVYSNAGVDFTMTGATDNGI